MESRAERAKELFTQGYNCSQAVLAAYCDEIGMDFETALKLSSSFGGGMGKLREVCGAVSSMFMIIGIKCGYTDANDDIAKARHYKLVQELAKKFKDENGSIICRDLLGEDKKDKSPIPDARTDEYYKKRPCAELVESACIILEEMTGNGDL